MYDAWLGEHVDYYDPDDNESDGPAECECCGKIFPESALAGDGLCGDCSVRVFGDAAAGLPSPEEYAAAVAELT